MNRSVSDSSGILGRLVNPHVIVHRTDVLEPTVLVNDRLAAPPALTLHSLRGVHSFPDLP